LSDQELSLLPTEHFVVFDNGEKIQAYRNETRYSALFWTMFAYYPNTRILPEHHVTSILKGNHLNADTHNRISTAIFRSIVKEENLFLPEQKEPLLALVYKTICYAQNKLTVMTEADIVSLDILDFVQISNHPEILGLKQQAMADRTKIKYAYDEGLKLIKTHPDFLENNLAKAVKANMVKPNQVLQCVMFIGFPSEVDGTIYTEPIWDNYTSGLNGFYELVADSRKAAKAHLYSNSALQDSEYNSRKFQLYAMVLERLAYEACDTTQLMPWRVKGPIYDQNGVMLYSGDIPRMAGKHYKTSSDASAPYKIIMGNETDLDDKLLWIRSILHCEHGNPHAICHLCTGEISQNISRFDNIGHIGTVTLMKDLSQTILSFKHVNTSAVMSVIALDDFEKKYLHTGKSGGGFFLKPPPKGKRISITIARDEAPGLIDLICLDDISQISLPRISSISGIKHCLIDKSGMIEESILKTKGKQSNALLSRDLLNYLMKVRWTVDGENNFSFDMSDWDYEQPILVTQNKEESVVDLVKQVERLVESNQQLHKRRLADTNAPQLLLQELFDLVNSKFNINFFCFEVVVYGLMAKANDNYGLARGAENPVLGISDSMTIHRSLGSALAYERQKEALFSPAYFYAGERPDNPMDVFVTPKEVIEAHYGPQA
jgi:hypothetical protein